MSNINPEDLVFGFVPKGSAPNLLKRDKATTSDVFSSDMLSQMEAYEGLNNRKQVRKMWKKQERAERKLRIKVAKWILFGLFFELIVGNTIFFFYGFGLMSFPEWVAKTFLIGMYSQVVTITLIVVKSLFPSPEKEGRKKLSVSDFISKK